MRFRLAVELLERRLALAAETFTVTTLANAGPGSLRQALLDANSTAGPDTIAFAVTGTIRISGAALPTIDDPVLIDGGTAPGFVSAPRVRVDFQNTRGFTITATATGSQIRSLSIVDSAAAGITIAASSTTVADNYIGLWENGLTIEANRGDGVLILAGANNNTIGVASTVAFQLSNVISGNRANGVRISGSSGNVVAANYIGTDASGQIPLGNVGQGIRLTAGANNNLIGGEATAGNDPKAGIFARPPQGNLISANFQAGIRIDGGSTLNQLSGNFIGTSASGNAPLGNRHDGVAIVAANGNRLIGVTAIQQPFVFYNVVSGNWRNGLRITNATDTVVHANFLGLGANNVTRVPNRGSGMVVNGNSQRVNAGGEIPLGNVMSGNQQFGILIADTAGGVLSFNNFVGQAAFGGRAANGMAGVRVTSSNPGFDINDKTTWNRFRTCLIGGNNGNGIEFLGMASGAEVTDTAIGTNYDISAALPNLGHGIVIGGQATKIAIGGFDPSIEKIDGGFSVHVGGNKGFGIVFQGKAHDVRVYNTRVGVGVGLTLESAYPIPNAAGGVFVGPGTSNITIGGEPDLTKPLVRYSNQIGRNYGNGLTITTARNTTVLATTVFANAASGVLLINSPGTVFGSATAPNIVSRNRGQGILATGFLAGSRITGSTITGNGANGLLLSASRGITVGGTHSSQANVISGNRLWGLLAAGWCRGSALGSNLVTGNSVGNVNTRGAVGLQT